MQQLFADDPKHIHGYFLHIALGIVGTLALIGLLQIVPPTSRKRVIALVTFIGGAFYALEFFLPIVPYPVKGPWDVTHINHIVSILGFSAFRIRTQFPWPQNWHSINLTKMLPGFGTASTVLQSFAVGLGIINLLGLHLKNIARTRSGWGNSVVLLTGFFAMLLWGLLNAYAPDRSVVLNKPYHVVESFSIFGLHHSHFEISLPYFSFLNAPIKNADIYDFLFYGGYANLDSSMFALIGFFIVSASYRAFRIRTAEASLLMAAAVIVMLSQVTLGSLITSSLPSTGLLSNFKLENLGLYLLKEFNAPAFRAINFGIGIGFLATSLRLWLSLERGAYFEAEG